jgi:hypothetical protein
MANGLQGSGIGSSSNSTVFTATTPIVVSLNVVNLHATNADQVRVYLVPSGASAANKYMIEYDTDLASKAVIERTGIVLGTGDYIVIYSNSGNSAFNVWGVEL